MANVISSKVKPVFSQKKKWPWVLGIVGVFLVVILGGMVVVGLILRSALSSSSSTGSSFPGSSFGSIASVGTEDTVAFTSNLKTAAGDIENTLAPDGSTVTVVDQKIIKTAQLSVVVNSTNDAVKGITQMAETRGGFVVTSETYTATDDSQAGSISIRIPADQFAATMTSIKNSVEVVESESVTGTDVTEEYIDLQARLNNAKLLEADYQNILSRSGSIEDTLKVTKVLSQARQEIESLQGQINFINARSNFSTITITLSERPNVIPSVSEKFDLLLVFQQAFQALVLLARAALITLIWVVVIGGPLFLLVWVVWKLARWGRRHGKSNSKA